VVAVDSRRQILLIAGRALLLLPVFLAAWYLAAAPIAWLGGKVATPVIRLIADGPTSMQLKDRSLLYTLTLEMPYRPGSTPRIAADVEVGAGKFTYGIALFLALALAARQSRQALPIIFGCVALLVLPGFGIAFDALKQLGSTPGMDAFLRWGVIVREGVALGYQAGTLLLPTLVPVAIWLYIARVLWIDESQLPR
jgi:hypothetical protein